MSAVAPMNFGAAHPDERLASPSMTIAQVRAYLERLQVWISDGYTYHDTMEYEGDYYTGKDMADDARLAESALYLIQQGRK